MALVLFILLAIGLIGLAILVCSVRAERNNNRLARQRASVVDLRTRSTTARGDEAARADVPADEATSVSGYHFNLFI